jgi:hypothetical protein
MNVKVNHRLLRISILLTAIAAGLSLAAAALVAPFIAPRLQSSQPDPLEAALRRVQAAGSYRFSSDITQVTLPTSKVTNVGRSSRSDRLHLEGETNLRAQSSMMHLWAQDGAVSDPSSGITVKVENGKTYVLEETGAWREQESLTDSFAPQGDFMAFLSALRDPVAHAPEERNGIAYTRFTFRLDGPALARVMRDIAKKTLAARGELPPGMELGLPAAYRDMTGDGELWIDSQGLPLRQILHMRFPEQHDEIVQAEIITDFSGYGQAAGSIGQPPGGNAVLGQLANRLPMALGLAAVMAFCILLLTRARVWRSLAGILIISLVFNPLLGDIQIGKAADASAARAAAQEQQREESRQRQELIEHMTQPQVDPHADPQNAVNAGTALSLPLTQGELAVKNGAAAAPAAPIARVDDGTDTDQDGLTDFEEEIVGTDPNYWDTDGDTISDTLEVKGFTLEPGGVQWFMDANNADSNRDGISDAAEYDFNRDGLPDDTDGDKIPDVFDDDNDGDGVPDNKDLAPFSVITDTFTAGHPFQFKLNNLTPGTPVFVDFQIRPTDEKHLWYAYNVLDWPANDREGQIQDDDGVTFAALPRMEGDPAPSANDNNGDMKLIPMLEIRIPNGSANLPPQADLTPYNISYNVYSNTEKVAYVPLSLISDEGTGRRVAFKARMRYLPSGSWTTAHQVRLVWLVQVLNDNPCDYQAADRPEGCSADNYVHNVVTVVHSYSDDWKLTGLNVKEDHGASQAIIYEDPTVDPDLIHDKALTALSAGLDQSFLSGRDQDGDTLRDVDLDEIVQRFDRLSNGSATLEQRWGIDNILRVEHQDYPTLDQAIMYTAMTDTMGVLDDRFGGPWSSNHEITPLLMYAQEARSRAVGMDAQPQGEGWVTWDGSAMVVDFHPAGQEAAPQIVTVNLKWMPYCSPAGESPTWSPCSMESWWEILDERYPELLPGDPENDPLFASGRAMVLNLYESVMMQGISRVVTQGSEIISPPGVLKTDNDLKTWFDAGNMGVKFVVNGVFMLRYTQPGLPYKLLRHLGEVYNSIQRGVNSLLTGIASWANLLEPGAVVSRNVTTGVVVGVGLALGCVLGWAGIDYLMGGQAGKITVMALVIGLQIFTGIIAPLIAVSDLIKGLKFVDKLSKLCSLQSEVAGFSKAAGVIGAVISAAITWGFFFYNMNDSHITKFSPEYNRALAEAIASTILIIVLLVLAATVIGGIIVAIVAVIDAILTVFCETGSDELKDAPGMGGACFTFSGMAVKAIAYFLYNYAPMVDVKAKDLLVLGAPQIELNHPENGLVDSNSLSFRMPVTTTVRHKVPDPADGLLIYI